MIRFEDLFQELDTAPSFIKPDNLVLHSGLMTLFIETFISTLYVLSSEGARVFCQSVQALSSISSLIYLIELELSEYVAS